MSSYIGGRLQPSITYSDERLKQLHEQSLGKIKQRIIECDICFGQLRAMTASSRKEIRVAVRDFNKKWRYIKLLVRKAEFSHINISRSLLRTIRRKIIEWELYGKQFKDNPLISRKGRHPWVSSRK